MTAPSALHHNHVVQSHVAQSHVTQSHVGRRLNRYLRASFRLMFWGAAGFLIVSGIGAVLTPLHARTAAIRVSVTLLFVLSSLVLVGGLLLLPPGVRVHRQRGYTLDLWRDTTPGQTRPPALGATTILMSICNLLGFGAIDWSYGSHLTVFLIASLVAAAGFVVLWFYWRGQNWARLLVLLSSVDSLLNLLALRHGVSHTTQTIRFIQASLAIFLLYWLNTQPSRSFFSRSIQSRTL